MRHCDFTERKPAQNNNEDRTKSRRENASRANKMLTKDRWEAGSDLAPLKQEVKSRQANRVEADDAFSRRTVQDRGVLLHAKLERWSGVVISRGRRHGLKKEARRRFFERSHAPDLFIRRERHVVARRIFFHACRYLLTQDGAIKMRTRSLRTEGVHLRAALGPKSSSISGSRCHKSGVEYFCLWRCRTRALGPLCQYRFFLS